jgi:multidrug resistance efflux pump
VSDTCTNARIGACAFRLRDSEITTLKTQVHSLQQELEEAREKARQANALLRQEVANSEKEAQLRAAMEERHSQTQVSSPHPNSSPSGLRAQGSEVRL